MPRNSKELYPDFTAEIDEIDKTNTAQGITPDLLYKIIKKHKYNSDYNKSLYDRYRNMEGAVPIFTREPRFDDTEDSINNKINNDFFSEIVDFKTGYFAGKAFDYSYSSTDESEKVTGGEDAIDVASKTLTDFVTRNNMFDVDMDVTKNASICGYGARLFYVDLDAEERVKSELPFECAILSKTDITEPQYSVRYYSSTDINDTTIYYAEFYDSEYVHYYQGSALSQLKYQKSQLHLFNRCPLQGIPNNAEMIGDAEKVLSLIDAYDRALSDSNNEIESFANAYMVYENVNVSDEDIAKAQKSGAIKFYSGASNGKVYFLTKDVNDTFTENHLNRIEDNIYRFSKTPNLNDDTYGDASGVALKFKLTGLETKCGMFEAKVISASTYMFKLLSEVWAKRKITVDPLQCVVTCKRNFPLDILSEAQAAQALIAAGLPKEVAFTQALSFIDDIDYVMQLIEDEQNSIPSLFQDVPDAFNDDSNNNNSSNKETKPDESGE